MIPFSCLKSHPRQQPRGFAVLKKFPKVLSLPPLRRRGWESSFRAFCLLVFQVLAFGLGFGFLFFPLLFFSFLFLRIRIKSILLLPFTSSIIGSFCFLPLCSFFFFFSLCLLWSVSVREVLKEQRYNRPSGSWEGLN